MRKIEDLSLLQFWNMQQPEFSNFLENNSLGSDTFEDQS